MSGGANTAVGVNLAVQEVPYLIAALIGFFGRRRSGMTGEQKHDAVVDFVAPLVPPALDAGGQIAINNSGDAAHKAEIGELVKATHDVLLAAGQIAPTNVLEGPTAPLPVGKPLGGPLGTESVSGTATFQQNATKATP